jgi:4-amino-4-deoxy-L-arabinose transferase-like glycosyltransferase
MNGPSLRTRVITLAAGLLLLAAGVALALSHRAVHPAATNNITTGEVLATKGPRAHFCQPREHVPAGTAKVRVSLGSLGPSAPRVELLVRDRAVRAKGTSDVRWSRHAVVVPLRSTLADDVAGRVCIRLTPNGPHERVRYYGEEPNLAGAVPGTVRSARLRFEYLYPAKTSWWQFAGTVMDRIGRAHVWSGRSVALTAALLTVVAIALASWQLVGVRRNAWVCALVAVANAIAWSIVMPAFQVPDEQAHYAYAEYVAQHGKAPVPALVDVPSASEGLALQDLGFEATRFHSANGTLWSAADQRRLARDLVFDSSRGDGNGGAYTFGGEPPLFYALQAIPYRIADGGTVLDRLALMRLLCSLLAGATVLFVFLFLREALPAVPWTWSVGALAVAFQPMFASISGGMNSDALLYATAAALFWQLARAFRRGLTRRGAFAVGVTLAVGMLTKFNFAGLVPGAAIGLIAIALRQRGARTPRLRALRLPALALGIGAAAVLLEMTLNVVLWDRPASGASANAFFSLSGVHLSLTSGISYVTQFYLVPLPGMKHYIDAFPLRTTWAFGFVGTFGFVDTSFRPLVNDLALVPLAGLLVGATAALVRARETVRRRHLELLVYAVMAAIFMFFIATASFIVYSRLEESIAQVRYLFPLLSLYGAIVVLAARSVGRRWMPIVGTAIVVLAITHDVFAQLLVVSRYYA